LAEQLISEACEAVERLEVLVQQFEQLILRESFGGENLGEGLSG
jgi:hypothetical protein